jgi:hypothetical protein
MLLPRNPMIRLCPGRECSLEQDYRVIASVEQRTAITSH